MARYFGLGKQSAFGSAATPNKFIDVISSDHSPVFEKDYPPTLQSRQVVLSFPLHKYSEVEVESRIWPEGGFEHVLMAVFQKVTTTTLDATNGVYQHLFQPAEWGDTITYYTLETGADVTAIRSINCVGDGIEFSFSRDAPPSFTATFIGDEGQAVSQTTPAYPTVRPFYNSDTSAEIGGSPVELIEASIEVANNLERRHDLSASLRAIELTGLEVSGSFSMRFQSTTHLSRFLSGNETSLKITLTGPVAGGAYNYMLELELPRIVYDAWGGEVSAGELLVEDVDFVALKPTTGQAITAKLINKVSTI